MYDAYKEYEGFPAAAAYGCNGNFMGTVAQCLIYLDFGFSSRARRECVNKCPPVCYEGEEQGEVSL